MNAEQVVNKILSEAKEKAETIVSEAKKRVETQIAETKTELAAYDKQSETLAEQAAQDKRDRMLAGARMANAKQLLAARVQILEDVFEKAKQAIVGLPDNEYLALMKSLLQKAVETGDEEVVIAKDDNRITPAFIKDVNGQLGSGFQGNLRLAEQRGDFAGGFILTRGNIRINASIDVLVDQVRQSLESELVEDIFAEK